MNVAITENLNLSPSTQIPYKIIWDRRQPFWCLNILTYWPGTFRLHSSILLAHCRVSKAHGSMLKIEKKISIKSLTTWREPSPNITTQAGQTSLVFAPLWPGLDELLWTTELEGQHSLSKPYSYITLTCFPRKIYATSDELIVWLDFMLAKPMAVWSEKSLKIAPCWPTEPPFLTNIER